MFATKPTAILWIGLVLTACGRDILDEDDDIFLDDDLDDIDDLDVMDDFEEYSFGSPQEVHQSWKAAINDLKETAKAAEAAGKKSTIPDSCKWGSQGCLHDDNSPLRQIAREEAKSHFVHRRQQRNSNKLNAALLPQIAHADVAIGSLPAPPNATTGGALTAAGIECDDGDKECLKKAAMSGALTPGMAAYVASMDSVDQVLSGAVVNTGALPNNVSEWEQLAEQSRDRQDKKTWGRDHVDVAWRVATERGERTARERRRNRTKVPFPSESDTMLKHWFEAKGGVINFAEVQPGRGHRRHLVVTADQSEDHPLEVLKVPFRLTMNKITMRNVGLECNGGCSFLKEHFGPIFKKKEEWGLAVLLLHEQAKGNQSRWHPFIQSLRMYMPTKQVLAELEGTFALELYRIWDEEAEAALQWVNHELCDKHFGKACNFGKTRKEYRWALQVVRSFAFNLTKRTSKSSFLALVPYGNLLQHSHGAGGSAILELDNTIRIHTGSGKLKAGTQVAFERGQLSDAETMLRYFRVDERDNPHAHIRMLLPGAQGERDELSSFFFRKWRSTMELWRRQMHYPPKMSHMWRMAKELNLYGYEDDEEEEEFMRSQTSDGYKKVLNALPMPEGDATAEEQLELLGYAEDTDAASLILTGKKDSGAQPIMLYTAQEIDENPNAEHAIQDMADAVLQLHESIAAGHTDPAVQTVIKQAREFLEQGVAPPKGLDEIDRLLMRKRFMLKQCGPAETHRINWDNISLALKCAIRVTVMNESDVDVLCPKATGPWNDHKCEQSIFNRSLAITWENEQAMIAALRASLEALLERMKHSLDEDESLLLLSSFGPAQRSAILLRMREKRLLYRALEELEQMEADIGDEGHVSEYQLLAIKRENEAKAKRRERRLEYIKKMQDLGDQRREVISLEVNLDKDKSERFVVKEGEDLGKLLDVFARKHRITQPGRAQLKKAAMGRVSPSPEFKIAVPVVLDDGRLRTLTLEEEDDNVTEAVQLFFAKHNVSVDLDEAREAQLAKHVEEMLAFRSEQQILSRFPVTVPDGRKVMVDIREGEQHDLDTHLRVFLSAQNLSPALAPQLAKAAADRLPDTLMSMPVDVPNQKKIAMKVSSRAAANTTILWDVARAFCKVNRLPETNVVNLVRGALRGLEPTAFVL